MGRLLGNACGVRKRRIAHFSIAFSRAAAKLARSPYKGRADFEL
jgi:hypothetical protein